MVLKIIKKLYKLIHENSKKIKNNELLNSHYYLKGKSLNDISYLPIYK